MSFRAITAYGILLVDANNFYGVTGPSNQNVIDGNYIGVAANGTTALANASDGVNIQGLSSGNTIGGSATGAGNLISGDGGSGVDLFGSAQRTTSSRAILRALTPRARSRSATSVRAS